MAVVDSLLLQPSAIASRAVPLQQTRKACIPVAARSRPLYGVASPQSRLLRRARCAVRCWATIPVPDSSPVICDLGWPVDFAQHYVKGKLIGQGSFGSVYLGIDLHSGREVAIKVMPKQRGKLTKERTLQKLAKEVGILQKMQGCKNTVRLLGCYETNEEVMVVTSLCSGGDLQKLSDDHGPKGLPERAVALIAYEVLLVIEECHKLGILHGDIKPANFVLANRTKNPLFSKDINLLFGDAWLLAIDFGCSQYLGPQRFSKRTGTPVYMAPEIFERDYHWEADMWSLGIMLYQLYARRFPFWKRYEDCRTAKLEEVAVLVAEAPIPLDYGPWTEMSKEGINFMQGCLQRDYQQRMTVPEALEHPWLMQWLPHDDFGAIDLSLDSLGTSSDEEDVVAYQQQQYQQQQLYEQQARQQRQQVVVMPGHHTHRQPHQHQVLLTEQQMQHQQHAAGASSDSHHLPGPGAYSSSSSSGSTGAGQPHHHQQQQLQGSLPPPPQQQQQKHQQPGSANGGGVTNNIVPGSRQQQQQQQQTGAGAPPVEVNAAPGRRQGQQ